MRKFAMLSVLFMFVFMQIAQSQNRTITGTVTSSTDGSTLPGVSIVVKGSTIGVTTDIDGKYMLEAPPDGQFLVFSFVGMITKEIEIANRTTIDVEMDPSMEQLDEVVVTALGISREKKSLGYAVQEVGADEITRTPELNVVNALAGKTAGVQIKTNTNIGGSSNIIIRGSNSLTGDNQALFVVDGIPVSNMNTNSSDQTTGRAGFDYGNPIADINPNDIESISVLKGAAATALYGSRAANGVVLIKTKKGTKSTTPSTKGKHFMININHSTMFHVFDKKTFPEYQKDYGAGYGPYYSGTDYPGLLYYDLDGDGTDDYVIPTTEDASFGSKYNPSLMVYQWDAMYPESPTYLQKSPYVVGKNTPDYFFETGHTITNGVDISGASQVSTYRLSYSNTDQTGIMPNSEIKKNSIMMNNSFDLFKDVTISSQAMYTNTYTKGRNSTGYSDNIMSSFRQWFNLGVDMKMQEEYYDLTKKNITWNPHDETDLSPIYWDNPYWQRYENYQDDERNRLIGYTQVDWKINQCFSYMMRYAIDYYNFLQEERKAVGSVSGEFGVGNPARPDVTSGYSRREIIFTETNFDMMLKYSKYLNEKLNLNTFIGTNMRRSWLDDVFASTNGGLAVPGTYSLSNSASAMLPPIESYERIGVDGIFGSASVGINNMVYIDLTARNDWSSTLPEGNNSYFYPSVSTSFIFSEVLDYNWLSLGKLRLNYAQVGKDAEWGQVFDSYRVVSPLNSQTLARLTTWKNNDGLKPELSTSIEGGLEFKMFNNRVGFDLAVYKETTKDPVIPAPVSFATGYSTKYINIGEMENKGVELSINGSPYKTDNFEWNVALNWAKNVNEVVDLGGDITNLQLASLQGGVSINAREGEPYGTIQGTDFKYAPDGQKIIDPDGYYEITGASNYIIGNIQPDWNAGITNGFRYKNIVASFLVDMQKGGDIFSLDLWYGMATGLYPETAENNDLGNPTRDPIVQNPDGSYASNSGGILLEGVVGVDADGDGEYESYVPNTTRIAGDDYAAYGYATSPNKRYVYDATWVKLREISIGYNLPKSIVSKIYLSGATVSIIGSNLWIIYKDLPYADPEASQGAGNVQGWQSGVMPSTKNFGFKINITI